MYDYVLIFKGIVNYKVTSYLAHEKSLQVLLNYQSKIKDYFITGGYEVEHLSICMQNMDFWGVKHWDLGNPFNHTFLTSCLWIYNTGVSYLY